MQLVASHWHITLFCCSVLAARAAVARLRRVLSVAPVPRDDDYICNEYAEGETPDYDQIGNVKLELNVF